MLRRSQTITATALALLCVTAPTAGASTGFTAETVPPPPSSIALPAEQAYQDLRETDKAPFTLNRDYGSPDAVDAARNLPPSEIPAPVVDVDAPASGFDWGDAGIGAAGMLALFSVAGGSALLLTGRKRRHAVNVAAH